MEWQATLAKFQCCPGSLWWQLNFPQASRALRQLCLLSWPAKWQARVVRVYVCVCDNTLRKDRQQVTVALKVWGDPAVYIVSVANKHDAC